MSFSHSNCDSFSSLKVDNNNNKKSIRRIRTKRRGSGGGSDLNANGLITYLLPFLLCCLISTSSCFVIPSSEYSASHPLASVSRHGSLPPSSPSPPSPLNSTKPSSPFPSRLSAANSNSITRHKRHILPTKSFSDRQSNIVGKNSAWSESRLPIKVRNNGGEVFKELISANTEADYIRIEYTDTDGSLVRTLLDFRNNLQIFRLVRLGEQDLNERRWQTYCFITLLPKDEYISADAMSKLTQKNPSTVRQAEIDHGLAVYKMDLKLSESAFSSRSTDLLSPHLHHFCEHAQGRIYASEEDLSKWRAAPATSGAQENESFEKSFANVTSIFSKLNPASGTPPSKHATNSSEATPMAPVRQCGELLAKLYSNFTSARLNSSTNSEKAFQQTSEQQLLHQFLSAYSGQLCHCSLSLVMPFYPCSVRHCSAPDPSSPGKTVSYRCGIKTCRRQYEFRFAVADKLACLPGFDPTLLKETDNVEKEGDSSKQKKRKAEEEREGQLADNSENNRDADGEGDQPAQADNSEIYNSKQVK